MKRSRNNQHERHRGWDFSKDSAESAASHALRLQEVTARSSRAGAVLESQIRAAGILLVTVSETGDLLRCPKRNEDWLGDLVCHSQMGRSLLTRAARSWSNERAPGSVELIPGLVMAPVPMVSRRRRTGYAVAVILTEDLSRSEHLSALCQSARMDYELVRRLLAQLPPASPGDVSRLVLLVHELHAATVVAESHEQTIEQTGRQLAESYEEISLLYTITQAMRVVQQPEKFVRMVCEELLGTLPYGWVGVLMRRDLGGTEQSALRSSLAGAFMVFGDPPHQRETCRLRSLAERLLVDAQPNVPMVLEPGLSCDYERYRELGRGAIVHPVSTDNGQPSVLGIIIAGEKLGEDVSASSVDMKLLGATCNHTAIFLENAALYDDLNTMFLGSLEALTASIDAKDRYTCGHSRRVAHLTQQLARAIGMSAAEVERMHIAGLVHDVGKIGVPERVLLKPGKLTDEEFGWIRRHPEIGYRILKDIPQLADVLPGVLYHHERWDGKGYPKGLGGQDIPLVARLLGLADAFDAMSSNRTYRPAMARNHVLEEIVKCAGTQFDPDLVPHFVKLDFAEFDRLVDEHKATDHVLLDGGSEEQW